MKQRFDSLDITKAFCILAVIIIHIPAFLPSTLFVSFIMGASMLVFFLVAGYTYKPGKSVTKNIINRAKRLLIPFAAYSICIQLIYSAIFVCTGTRSVSEVLIWIRDYYCTGKVGLPIMPYWFLITLFLASVVFYLIADFALVSGKRTAIISLILLSITAIYSETVSISLPWTIEMVPAFAGILLIGAYAGQKQILSKLQWQGKKSIFLIVAAAILLLILSITCGTATVVSQNKWGKFGGFSVYIALIQGILETFMLVLIGEGLTKTKKLRQGLVWLGQHSMEFYMIHLAIAYCISQITGWKMFAASQQFATTPIEICQTLLLFVITFFLCILWTFLCQAVSDRFRKKKLSSQKA